MHRRTRQRLTEAAILLLVTAIGAWAYGRIARPDPRVLVDLAERKLREIFGDGVRYDDVSLDLLDGVEIHGLSVRSAATQEPTLLADRVEVRHDVLALAAGAYVPRSIVIEGARIVTHETPDGVAPDFFFQLREGEAGGRVPEIHVRGGRVLYRAMEDSVRFQPRTVLELVDLDLDVVPTTRGELDIQGGCSTLRLGQDDVRIQVHGFGDARADRLEVVAVWDPLLLTPELVGSLADGVADALREQGLPTGRLVVSLVRHPEVEAGQLRVSVGWAGEVELDVAALPSVEAIDARTREQLRALLGRGSLDVVMRAGGLDVRGLALGLAGGTVVVTGRIEGDGEAYRLTVRIRGLRLEDPAIREALGPEGAQILDAFEPTGVVDADVLLVREPGQEPTFEVDAILEDASFRYVGTPDEEGGPTGFPYRVEQAAGHLRITPGLVVLDDIVGFNGSVTVRLRGHGGSSWTGGETGVVRLTDQGPEIHLTVEAAEVPVDRELREAVDGSEFAGLLERFRLAGRVDLIEVDIVRLPGLDEEAVAEVRIQLGQERFSYAEFPLPLDAVSGWVVLRRPPTPGAARRRGRLLAFDVHGLVEGAPVHAWATVLEDEGRGRLQVEARGVPLAGALTEVVTETATMRDGVGAVWRFLGPRGRADVDASFPLAGDPDPLRLAVRLAGASVRLGAETAEHPIELVDLTGTLDVEDDRVRIVDVVGRVATASVALEGEIVGGPEGRWALRVVTGALRVTPALEAGVLELLAREHLLGDGLRLLPGSRLALDLALRRDPGADQELRATVEAKDLDAAVALPGGTVVSVYGDAVRIAEDELVLDRVHGSAPGIEVVAEDVHIEGERLEGRLRFVLDDFRAGDEVLELAPAAIADLLGSWTAGRLLSSEGLAVEAHGDGSLRLEGDLALVADPEAQPSEAARGRVRLLPLELGPPDAAGTRRLRGRVRFDGLSLDPALPVRELEGEADLEDVRLGDQPEGRAHLRARSVRLLDLTLRDLDVPLRLGDGILEAAPITADLAGGRLEAWLRVHARAPVAYEGALQVADFDVAALRADLAPTGGAYQGRGNLQVSFQNRGGDLRSLTASGALSVREGNLGDLPFLANVIALFSRMLGSPDPPRFERADASFRLEDEVVTFDRLDLAGPLFRMPGRGTLDLGGTVDLVFRPSFIKSMVLPGVMDMPGLGPALDAILREDLLYEVRVRGDLARASPQIVPVPRLNPFTPVPFEGTGVPEPPSRRVPRWFR